MNTLQGYHSRTRAGCNSLFPFNLGGISSLSSHLPSFSGFSRSSRRSLRPHFQRCPSYEASCYDCETAMNGAHVCGSCLDRAYQLGAAYPYDHFACSCALCDFYDDIGYSSGYWSEPPQLEVFPPPQHRHSGNWISRAGLASIASTTYFSGGHGKRGGLPRRGGY